MGELTVIWWRDIPAQLTATDGTRTVRRELPERFAKAIDAAAMKAGLIESDDYLDAWRRESRPCDDDLDHALAAEAAHLETTHDRETVLALVRNGGLREG